jgi:hypothetical protein
VALAALVGAGVAAASPVRLVVRPKAVRAGGVIRVTAAASPCLVRDQVTLISRAFRGHAFGGEGAAYGVARRHGSFAVRTRIRAALHAGRYEITARCGGGNLGVAAWVRVVRP